MKKLYTYCQPDGTIIGMLEFQDKPDFSTEKIYEGNFIVPKLNFETDEFYEGATEQEIEAHNKSKVPTEVPLWAMRNVLKKRNLFDAIINAVNQFEEPLKSDALDFLEYGNFIERYSNSVLLIQQITQMSETEADNLFIEANNIKL